MNRYYWHKQGGVLRRELPEFYYEISDKFTISDTEQNSNKHKRPENNETRTKHKNCSKVFLQLNHQEPIWLHIQYIYIFPIKKSAPGVSYSRWYHKRISPPPMGCLLLAGSLSLRLCPSAARRKTFSNFSRRSLDSSVSGRGRFGVLGNPKKGFWETCIW